MVELVTYADEALPADLACQVLSFMRVEWPDGFAGERRLRGWIHRTKHRPIHVALVEEGVLVSYAGVLQKDLEHGGVVYRTYGLSGVFTYPAFRRQGYGRQVVAAATEHIRASDADIGLFTCQPHNRGFYAANGWMPLERAVLFGGPRSAPYRSEELILMGFFSTKGRQGRSTFEATPIYFDDDLW